MTAFSLGLSFSARAIASSRSSMGFTFFLATSAAKPKASYFPYSEIAIPHPSFSFDLNGGLTDRHGQTQRANRGLHQTFLMVGQGAGKHLARMHPAAIFGPLVGDFMQSVPVRETILRAYGFAGRRALPLLGLGWLSAVFYFAATAYFLTRLSATMLVWPR